MRRRLSELLDIPSLEKLFINFTNISGMVASILDPDGEILLAVGWQDICTKFHRVCPQTECRCRQSDDYFKEHLYEKNYIVYQCLNGLTDCAVPIIVDNHHLGTFFTGQFLSEPPDKEFFRRQAREYGFDESAYMNALDQVPIINGNDMELIMEFYTQLTKMLSTMGLQRMYQLENLDEKVRRSEERLRLALEGSNNGFWDWNLETGVLYYSPSWHRMLGYSKGDLEPSIKAWKNLIHHDDRPYVIKRINDHIQGRTSQYEAEYRLLTKSGDWKWIQGVGKVAARDENDRALRMTGINTDINERKKAEQQLQEERNFNAALLDTAGDLIVVTDHEDRIILFNQVCEQITGYTFNEVKGKYVWEMIAPEDIDYSRSVLAQPMFSWDSPGLKLKFENRWLTRDGKRRLINWTTTFLSNEHDAISYVISTGSDITQQRLMEEKLHRSEGEMRAVAKRSQELVQELESANRELKDFAYIISHDLKAPLRGIRSLAEWIYADNHGKFDEVGREQLNLLVNRTTRMHNLLDGILEYSKLSRNEEQKTEIETNEVVMEAIEMLAPPDNISIIIENELPLVFLERTRIIQLFVNLLSNAIKYMDKPMGVIKISCQSQKEWWQFSISDNGPGIEERYFDKIFTIFQTLKPRDEFESTGIGLTIVKKIVGMYGGNVWVESKVGLGSTFHFTLPAL